MVRINYAELKFDHAVIFTHEETVFAAARENVSGKTRLFLIFKGDRVYTRNGLASSWELLAGNETADILNRIYHTINNEGLPTYELNGGSSRMVAGEVTPAN